MSESKAVKAFREKMNMFRITASEYSILLEALRCKYGFGYSDQPQVGKLQAKLSIMGEAAAKVEQMMDNKNEDNKG